MSSVATGWPAGEPEPDPSIQAEGTADATGGHTFFRPACLPSIGVPAQGPGKLGVDLRRGSRYLQAGNAPLRGLLNALFPEPLKSLFSSALPAKRVAAATTS